MTKVLASALAVAGLLATAAEAQTAPGSTFCALPASPRRN